MVDGYAGADPRYRLRVRVVTEYAWHSLFISQLLIKPGKDELEGFEPDFKILVAPGVQADPSATAPVRSALSWWISSGCWASSAAPSTPAR